MNAKTLCIYHANCADGFAAAWVVRRALGDQVEFHPASYGEAPPDVAGRPVLIVDFSYKREILQAMAGEAAYITILDHHKSAQADLVEFYHPRVACTFDMERSGARLAWDHFFKDLEPPPVLLRVEDRDLWRYALAGTREIMAAVFSHPYDFATWDALMEFGDLAGLYLQGQALERKRRRDLDEMLKAATRVMEIGGHLVPAANLPHIYASEAAGQLADGMLFAATYYDTDSERVFSLRSAPNGLDVSEIAKLYGGGGHKHAAGFRVSRVQAWRMEGFGGLMRWSADQFAEDVVRRIAESPAPDPADVMIETSPEQVHSAVLASLDTSLTTPAGGFLIAGVDVMADRTAVAIVRENSASALAEPQP